MNPDQTPQAAPAAPITPQPVPPVPPVASTPAQTSAPVVSVRYAGFWIRFVAYFVDAIIIGIVSLVVVFIMPDEIGQVVTTILACLYFIFFTHYKGATLGKMLVGISVKSNDLQKLSLGKVILREFLGRIVNSITIGIGYLVAAFTDRKRGLHDMIASSVVVYNQEKTPTWRIVVAVLIGVIPFILLTLFIMLSVVLVSLNSARTVAQDARDRATLAQVRTLADVYAVRNNDSYGEATNCSSGVFADTEVAEALAYMSSEKKCFAHKDSYAVSAVLKEGSFCLDNSGSLRPGTATSDGQKAVCQAQ